MVKTNLQKTGNEQYSVYISRMIIANMDWDIGDSLMVDVDKTKDQVILTRLKKWNILNYL